MKNKLNIILFLVVLFLGCESDDVTQYFEYPEHNVLNIGSQLKDLCITNDSNLLIACNPMVYGRIKKTLKTVITIYHNACLTWKG